MISIWETQEMEETARNRQWEEENSSADDFGASLVESEFAQARYYIGQAVEQLVRAAEIAQQYGKEKPIDELIEKLDEGFRSELDGTEHALSA